MPLVGSLLTEVILYPIHTAQCDTASSKATRMRFPVKKLSDFDLELLRYFLNELRSARYAALEDAENFSDICSALEELGKHVLDEKKSGLGGYRDALVHITPPSQQDRLGSALKRVIEARNDKAHTGSYARNAVEKAITVSAILEDILMQHMQTVEDIMVQGVLFAEKFMTLAKVRELMLAHSFSYLPIKMGDEYFLLSDAEVARQWRMAGQFSRERNLIPLKDLEDLRLIPMETIKGSTKLSATNIPEHPRLVLDDQGNIIGIVSPFDWL